jgi:hypothetical protein
VSKIDRRALLMAGAAFPFADAAPLLAQSRAARLEALAPAAALTRRARAFVASLDAENRKRVSFPWNGPQWRRWDYFGASGYTKPGLRLEQMSASEKDAAWGLFVEVLSRDGLTKAENVMRLQETLIEEGDGVGQRSAEKFSVSIFGVPRDTGPWGVRLEGHHLSLSFAVDNNNIVSVTPQAFAVRPARVTRGRHKGLVTIGPEEDLARALMADLTAGQQARARVADRHLFNILSTAGRERANAKPVGLSGGDMSGSARTLLTELLRTYIVAPYAGPVVEGQAKRLASTAIETVHFAWYGDNRSGKSFGYRVIAPGFVIEMGSIDSEAQHLHPVYHDLGNVLGSTA